MGAEVVGNYNDWGLKVLLDRRAQGGFMGDSHASGNIVDGRIHTSALTWDGATGACKFYLDGELQGGFTQGLGTIANFGFAIAQFKENGNSAFFTGDIAVVQLYRSIEDIGKLHLALTDCIASAPNYGEGLAGKLGIPTLTPSAAPVFLRNINVLASNSSGTAALGLVLVVSAFPSRSRTCRPSAERRVHCRTGFKSYSSTMLRSVVSPCRQGFGCFWATSSLQRHCRYSDGQRVNVPTCTHRP